MSRGYSKARTAAMLAGKKMYEPEPDRLCKHGHVSLRRVLNGSCLECERLRRRVKSTQKGMEELYPDMLLSRKDARGLKLSVYRTGEECKRGHKGWRYTKTGACVTCRREVLK